MPLPKLLPLFVLASCAVASSALPTRILQVRSSLVQILYRETAAHPYQTICSGGQVALESGVKLLSAGHCVEEDPSGEYAALDSQHQLHPLALERWEHDWGKKVDYALFAKVEGLPALKSDYRPIEVGENVFSWSGPLGLALMPLRGYFLEYLDLPTDDQEEEGMGLSTLEADGGASGSVVLDSRGQARAILVGAWTTSVKLDGSLFVPLPH